jgi:type IV pilus assembly protein PilW
MKNNIPASRCFDQRGLTLVELMVALVMGLILLAGLATVLIANKKTYRHQDALARLQENGRFAISILERDIRSAGNTGLEDVPVVADTVAPSDEKISHKACDADDPPSGIGEIIDGFDYPAYATDLAFLNPAPVAGTDVLRVSAGEELGVKIIKQPGAQGGQCPGSAPLFVSGCSQLNPGMVVMALTADGDAAARFVVAGMASISKKDCASDNHENLLHDTGTVHLLDGSEAAVKNCSKCLKDDFTGGSLIAFRLSVYYVGVNPTTGIPSLYRSLNFGTSEEIVEGVEDMQLRFAMNDVPGGVSEYRDASDIWGGAAQWANVRAVGVKLRLISVDPAVLDAANDVRVTLGGGTSDQLSYQTPFAGYAAGFSDKRWRQVYVTNVAVRNRVP